MGGQFCRTCSNQLCLIASLFQQLWLVMDVYNLKLLYKPGYYDILQIIHPTQYLHSIKIIALVNELILYLQHIAILLDIILSIPEKKLLWCCVTVRKSLIVVYMSSTSKMNEKRAEHCQKHAKNYEIDLLKNIYDPSHQYLGQICLVITHLALDDMLLHPLPEDILWGIMDIYL